MHSIPDGKAVKFIPTTTIETPASSGLAGRKIYIRSIGGFFQRIRNSMALLLLGLFYVTPWLQWQGRQAVLFDLPARKFHVLGLVFWPQDFVYLSVLLILAALGLFLVSALAGRVWCGHACPQTVWTKVFVWLENIIEGSRSKRMRMDAGPWTAEKVLRRAAKHGAWIAFALWTGFTFVGFFTPILSLADSAASGSLGTWEMFWWLFYAAATYVNAGLLREMVCLHMCPYARFQSVMFDRDTLVIAYDATRGENRGSRRRDEDHRAAGLGDCIDCQLCVQVCPTGIDIRNGLQYECIACGACIDACDSVMDIMGYAKGLVRYTTAAPDRKPDFLRWRVVAYATAIALIGAGATLAFWQRTPLGLNVLHDRTPLYRELEDGSVENGYLLRILNQNDSEHRFRVEVAGLPGIQVETQPQEIRVEAGEVASVAARVRVDAGALQKASEPIEFRLRAIDSPLSHASMSRFLGPVAE